MSAPFSISFNVPWQAAIDQAQSRGVLLPEAYYALPDALKGQAQTISSMTILDQIQRVQDAMTARLTDGGTFAQFKKEADSFNYGLNKNQLDLVFRNAVQNAYQAGHWRNFEANKASRGYLMYSSINDGRTSPAHRALSGIIRPVDDAFWATHSPPCGHRCRCTLISLTEAQARDRSPNGAGLNKPIEGLAADKGWGYRPTESHQALSKLLRDKLSLCSTQQSLSFAAPRKGAQLICDETSYARTLAKSLEGFSAANYAMPEARALTSIERLKGSDSELLFKRFMQEFNSTELTDKTGALLQIDEQLFRDRKGQWKIQKNERAQWLLFTARNIKSPDEIWLEAGQRGGVDKRYFLSRFDLGKGKILACIAVFERKQGATGIWTGVTNYATTDSGYIERKRNKDIKGGQMKYWRSE